MISEKSPDSSTGTVIESRFLFILEIPFFGGGQGSSRPEGKKWEEKSRIIES